MTTTYDFNDGNGSVAITDNAFDTVIDSINAPVSVIAGVSDDDKVSGNSWVYGTATTFGGAWVSGDACITW